MITWTTEHGMEAFEFELTLPEQPSFMDVGGIYNGPACWHIHWRWRSIPLVGPLIIDVSTSSQSISFPLCPRDQVYKGHCFSRGKEGVDTILTEFLAWLPIIGDTRGHISHIDPAEISLEEEFFKRAPHA